MDFKVLTMEEDRYLTQLCHETVQLYLCKLFYLFLAHLMDRNDYWDGFHTISCECYYFNYFSLLANDFGLMHHCTLFQYKTKLKDLSLIFCKFVF